MFFNSFHIDDSNWTMNHGQKPTSILLTDQHWGNQRNLWFHHGPTNQIAICLKWSSFRTGLIDPTSGFRHMIQGYSRLNSARLLRRMGVVDIYSINKDQNHRRYIGICLPVDHWSGMIHDDTTNFQWLVRSFNCYPLKMNQTCLWNIN